MLFPFEYILNTWNELDEKEEIVHGITFGKNYTEAMSNIEGYYGDTIIAIEKLCGLEEVSVPVYEIEMNGSGGILSSMFNI